MPKKKPDYALEDLCTSCQIEELFDRDIPFNEHLDTLMRMLSTTYSNELHVMCSLMSAILRVANGWADEHPAPPMRKGKGKVIAIAARG